jgi:hypothetical protein
MTIDTISEPPYGASIRQNRAKSFGMVRNVLLIGGSE